MNFQFNHKQASTYWWARIGKRWHIKQNPQGFRISFIVKMSKDRLYGLKEWIWTIGSAIIIEFIKEILEARKNIFDI